MPDPEQVCLKMSYPTFPYRVNVRIPLIRGILITTGGV